MTSLNEKLKRIKDALASIEGLKVFHYFHFREELPYCLWMEAGEADSLETNNHKSEQAILGQVDYFFQEEFDSMVDKIQEALNSVEGLSFSLNSVEYAENEKLIHYSWIWRLV